MINNDIKKRKAGESEDKSKEKHKKLKMKKKAKRREKLDLTSEISSDPDGIDEDEMYAAPLSDLEVEGPEEVEYLQPTGSNINPGTHVLVNVIGGYRKTINYKYVCCVQSILPQDDDDQDDNYPNIRVMGLRCVDEHATTFCPQENDMFVVFKNQIIGVLPDPEVVTKDRKLLYIFPGTVAVFEKS